jgi:cyclic pyranopterin phosphate synthase
MTEPPGFTHLDRRGAARMVDVAAKEPSHRVAEAEAWIWVGPEVVNDLRASSVPKGDAWAVARLAGIQATKQTAQWIPLAHPVPLTHASVELEVADDARVRIRCRAETVARTGVEMEAMCGASAAALALYDMIKSRRRDAEIQSVHLVYKAGGKSGEYRRPAEADRSG